MANTHQLIGVRYANAVSHLSMIHHASGEAITTEISTSFAKSFDNKNVSCETEAPSTFRTPISRVRWITINAARPNKPRQAINMVNAVKVVSNFNRRSSAVYIASNASSRKL